MKVLKNSIKYIALGLLLPLIAFGGYFLYSKSLYDSKRFRSNLSGVHYKRFNKKHFLSCLDRSHPISKQYTFSGSGNINFDEIDQMNKQHGGPLYIVNLRVEDLEYFDRKPNEYYGIYHGEGGYYYESQREPEKLAQFQSRRGRHDLPETIDGLDLSKIESESDILGEMGVQYVHFPMPDKVFANDWEFVTELMALFKSFPEDAWVHFHCENGAGRTTTAMVLYDMYKNGTMVPAEEILTNHFCIGGEDLADTRVRKKGTWKKEFLENRRDLVFAFYAYMDSAQEYPQASWGQWLESHPTISP